MSNEIEGGDAGTLEAALKFIYLGFIEQQQKVITEQLPAFISVANFLQVDSLARACKILMHKHLAKIEGKQVYCSFILGTVNVD